jgi:hypothetical protein
VTGHAQVYTRDTALRRTGQIEDFTGLVMPLRFNAVSGWQLTLDAHSEGAQLLGLPGGIIVERDGVTLLSGPVTNAQRVLSGDGETLTVTGVDDTVWLERRLALPVPMGPPYTAATYDDRSGVAETVMRGYVDANLGPTAAAARRLPHFALAPDLGRGASVRGRARFHTLLELLQRLALAGGDLGFRIVQVDTTLEFQVYAPSDRTATAIFGFDFGNLVAYDYVLAAPSTDYVYVGGQGEGTARVFVEGGDQAVIDVHGRIETFRDRRDTDAVEVLEQERATALLEGVGKTVLSITPVDTDAVAFGRDYLLGDRVTVVIDGEPIRDVVREVQLSLTGDRGEVISPVVGTPGASSPTVPALFDAARRLSRRLSSLERR